MKSKIFRNDPLFLRNEFEAEGRWGFPIIKKQEIVLDNMELISYSDICSKDEKNLDKGVHFFVDDYRFDSLYDKPNRSLETLKKYKFVLTPDYSLYAEMNPWRQIESVGKARWIGAMWQSEGMIVIPTVSWGLPRSFEFCFDGDREQLRESFEADIDSNFDSLFEMVKDIQKKLDYLIKTM